MCTPIICTLLPKMCNVDSSAVLKPIVRALEARGEGRDDRTVKSPSKESERDKAVCESDPKGGGNRECN